VQEQGGPSYQCSAARCRRGERYLGDEARTTTSKPRWVIVTAIIVLAAVAFAYLF